MSTNADFGKQTPAAKPRGWFSRNWLWFIPTLLVGGALGCCGGALVIITTFWVAPMKNNDPYTKSLKKVQFDHQVTAELGQPIEDATWMPVGEINLNNDRGDAHWDFDVAGPKGKAHVHTEAKRAQGAWGIVRLEVTFLTTGKKVLLSNDEQKGADEAPPFKP